MYTDYGDGLGMGAYSDALAALKAAPPTPDEKRRAARVICSMATDTDDALTLLSMLGLLEDPDVARMDDTSEVPGR